MSWINYGCGPFNAPAPWINVDVVRTADITPNMVVSKVAEEACLDIKIHHGRAERIYMGHVLEHLSWQDAHTLLVNVRERLMLPNSEIVVVGPDLFKVLHGWKEGRYEDRLVNETIEYDLGFQGDHPDLDAARHHWNCTEQRVVRLLEESGYVTATPMSLDNANNDWPLTSTIDWQCCVHAWS